MFQSGLQGLTGNIEFNEGKRSNFKLDLLKLKKEEIQKVGHWTPSEGINITDPSAFYDIRSPNITLIVMTREVSSPLDAVLNTKNSIVLFIKSRQMDESTRDLISG